MSLSGCGQARSIRACMKKKSAFQNKHHQMKYNFQRLNHLCAGKNENKFVVLQSAILDACMWTLRNIKTNGQFKGKYLCAPSYRLNSILSLQVCRWWRENKKCTIITKKADFFLSSVCILLKIHTNRESMRVCAQCGCRNLVST